MKKLFVLMSFLNFFSDVLSQEQSMDFICEKLCEQSNLFSFNAFNFCNNGSFRYFTFWICDFHFVHLEANIIEKLSSIGCKFIKSLFEICSIQGTLNKSKCNAKQNMNKPSIQVPTIFNRAIKASVNKTFGFQRCFIASSDRSFSN